MWSQFGHRSLVGQRDEKESVPCVDHKRIDSAQQPRLRRAERGNNPASQFRRSCDLGVLRGTLFHEGHFTVYEDVPGAINRFFGKVAFTDESKLSQERKAGNGSVPAVGNLSRWREELEFDGCGV